MGRAFSPHGFSDDVSWGVAPGWDGGAPLALSESSPQTLAIDLWMFFFLIRDLGFESFDLVLVALDLRQDLLLHLQRRQGDLEVTHLLERDVILSNACLDRLYVRENSR